MNSSTRTVIVGAGPYGLSLAAHLRERGVPFRIFGEAMGTWATQMPEGMKLKSDGFASNLFPGSGTYTLQQFSTETGRPYHPTHHPVALEDFIAYGREFARRFVPDLEACQVTLIESPAPGQPPASTEHGPARFLVHLDDGEIVHASEVVVAVGLTPFPYVPDALKYLPEGLVTHTADHRTFAEFRGCDVTVLGRGASALNAVALLNENGARSTLISRRARMHIHRPPLGPGRSLWQRLRHPSTPLGPSLRSWFATNMPMLFHAMPQTLRSGLFYRHLGPAGGVSLRGRIRGKLPTMLGWSIRHADALPPTHGHGPRIRLTLVNAEGQTREHVTSHIIAGTGYRVDTKRIGFLGPQLRSALRTEDNGAPRLNSYFGTSVPGLYFVGPAAASSFGPLLRFTAGAQFASQRVSEHLAKKLARDQQRATRNAAKTRAQVKAPVGQYIA